MVPIVQIGVGQSNLKFAVPEYHSQLFSEDVLSLAVGVVVDRRIDLLEDRLIGPRITGG